MAEPIPTKRLLEYKSLDPNEVSAEDIAHLQAVAYRGVPLSEVGKAFDLSTYELLRLMQRNPNLKKAIDKAEAHIKISVSEKLIEQINRGNVQAIKWFEQSRFGYSDKNHDAIYIQREIDSYLDHLRKTLSSTAYDEVARATANYREE